VKAQMLSEVCEIVMGQAPPGSSYNQDGQGLPLIGGASDLGKLTPKPTKFTTNPSKLSQPGDIILCIRATIGNRNWSDREYCLGRGVAGLRAHPKTLDAKYLWHYLDATSRALESRARGSTFKQVNSKDIGTLPILLPPLPEQRRIAAILDYADSLHRKREQAKAIVKELRRSAFMELFGGPLANPMWPSKELSDVAEIGSGIMKGRDFGGQQTTELPYLRVANVQDGYLDLDEIKTITVPVDEVDRYLLQPGDVLMTEGGDFDKLGRGAIWQGQVARCIHQNHIYRVRPRKGVVVSEYLSALTGSAYGKQYFLHCAKQTTGIATINKTQLGRFPVLVPPFERQQRFAEVTQHLQKVENRLLSLETQSKKLGGALASSFFTRGV
jgi:type I restriction enzyme, S subunit